MPAARQYLCHEPKSSLLLLANGALQLLHSLVGILPVALLVMFSMHSPSDKDLPLSLQ